MYKNLNDTVDIQAAANFPRPFARVKHLSSLFSKLYKMPVIPITQKAEFKASLGNTVRFLKNEKAIFLCFSFLDHRWSHSVNHPPQPSVLVTFIRSTPVGTLLPLIHNAEEHKIHKRSWLLNHNRTQLRASQELRNVSLFYKKLSLREGKRFNGMSERVMARGGLKLTVHTSDNTDSKGNPKTFKISFHCGWWRWMVKKHFLHYLDFCFPLIFSTYSQSAWPSFLNSVSSSTSLTATLELSSSLHTNVSLLPK